MNETELWDSRTRRLLGDAAADDLDKKHVLVLGLGGVGGHIGNHHHQKGAVGHRDKVVLVFLLFQMVEVEGYDLVAFLPDSRHRQVPERAATRAPTLVPDITSGLMPYFFCA